MLRPSQHVREHAERRAVRPAVLAWLGEHAPTDQDLLSPKVPVAGLSWVGGLADRAVLLEALVQAAGKGAFQPEEVRRLPQVGRALGFSTRRTEQVVLDLLGVDLESVVACATLGLQVPAAEPAIKKAFREQARRYHPDRVQHLGQEFQSLARDRMIQLVWARDHLLATDVELELVPGASDEAPDEVLPLEVDPPSELTLSEEDLELEDQDDIEL
jgi:hypothetical protein